MATKKKRANAVPLSCKLRVIRPKQTKRSGARLKIEMTLDRENAMALAGKIVRLAE